VSEEFTKQLEDIQSAPDEIKFHLGDRVRLKQSNTIGEIISIIDDKFFIVLTGDLRIKVNKRELKIEQVGKSTILKQSTLMQSLPEKFQREIDLRGMYGDEAITAVDKFIDSAILSGLNRIDIIHGKGTGVLRKKITEYLKNNPSIISYRLGEWNEGGSGVTVVELK